MAHSDDNKMIGRQFGRLTVIERAGSIKGKNSSRKTWLCRCTCGNTVVTDTKSLRTAHRNSCGCLLDEARRRPKIDLAIRDKHLRLMKVLKGMKSRCYDKNYHEYHRYGGRGIKVCDEWLNDSKSFVKWCLENGYKEGLTIDRIDNDGMYEPSNCQFLTRSENTLKQRKSFTIGGVTLRYSELSEMVGCAKNYFGNRINRVGFNKAYIGLFHKLLFNIA